jgi:hypothetical protein
MVRLVFLLSVFLILMSSCSKDEPYDPSYLLESYWTYLGMQDTVNKSVIVPPLVPDSLENFNMDIVFRRIGYYSNFEFEGQGPCNLFWGEFNTSPAMKLKLSNLYATDSRDYKEPLLLFEKSWTDSLLTTKAFLIRGDTLFLILEGSHRLVYTRNDRLVYPKVFFMSATVDNWEWASEPTNSKSTINYDTVNYSFNFTIESYTRDSIGNGRRYLIDLYLKKLPLPGIYDFINKERQIPEGGAGANIYGWTEKLNSNYFTCWSDQGKLQIDHASRGLIEGRFSFHSLPSGAVHYITDSNVEEGEFKIPVHLTGRDWFIKYRN